MYSRPMVNKNSPPVKQLESRAKFARRAGVSAAAVTKACSTILKPAVDGKYIDVGHPVAIAYLKRDVGVMTKMSATGIDQYYDEAVAYCHEIKRISISAIQRKFKIGYNRAKTIVDMMHVAGVVIDMSKPAPAPPPPKKKTVKKKAHGGSVAKEAKKSADATTPTTTTDNTIFQVPDDIQVFADMTIREAVRQFGTDTRMVDWLRAVKSIEDINAKRIMNAEKQGELVSKKLVLVGVFDVFNAAHMKLMKDGAKSIGAGVISKHLSGASSADIEHYISDILGSFIKPVKDKIIRSLKNA